MDDEFDLDEYTEALRPVFACWTCLVFMPDTTSWVIAVDARGEVRDVLAMPADEQHRVLACLDSRARRRMEMRLG